MDRRNFIKLGGLCSVALFSGNDLVASLGSNYKDIIIVGGTPSGIMAAIAAARKGMDVMLVEYHNHIGGMSASGLGKSDIVNKDAIGGLFREFTQNIFEYYVEKYGVNSENVNKCKHGYFYEPSVAEKVFNKMISEEQKITLMTGYELVKVNMNENKISAAKFKNRKSGKFIKIKGGVFIDATYEGDLYAFAGASFRIGRESKYEFDEKHAGVIFFDHESKEILEGSTGEADKKLPAYTYRLCLTDDIKNSFILKQPPEGYNRKNYLKYFDDLENGRLSAPKNYEEGQHGYYDSHFDTMVRVFSFSEIPNNKYDVNINPRPLGFPFPELNKKYIESNWVEREKISRLHRNLTLGLLYFIQNDSEVPKEHRELANKYHLPLDEFQDNDHFPWQLYIREGRRLNGKYLLTENDLKIDEDSKRTPIFEDTIITGEYPIDSFPCSKIPSFDKKVLEGYIGLLPVPNYQIPYGIFIPEKINGLIVPVAASATHVAYSTIRMEPLWMGIGQAIGTAAALSLLQRIELRDIPISLLQKTLLVDGQILTYFDNFNYNCSHSSAIQFWGTKGFFNSYTINPDTNISSSELERWMDIFCDITGHNNDFNIVKEDKVHYENFIKILNKIDSSLANDSMFIDDKKNHGFLISKGEICYELFKRIN